MTPESTLWRDMVHVALRSIRGQVLRTALTVGIIGIGIMALIAMVTATESLKASVRQEFSALGTQSFSIDQMRSGGMFGGLLGGPPQSGRGRGIERACDGVLDPVACPRSVLDASPSLIPVEPASSFAVPGVRSPVS